MKREPLLLAVLILMIAVVLKFHQGSSSGDLPDPSAGDLVSRPVPGPDHRQTESPPVPVPVARGVPVADRARPPATVAPPGTPPPVPQPRISVPVDAGFIRDLVNGPDTISLTLPDGRVVTGLVEQRFRFPDGSPAGVDGRVEHPVAGRFNFRRQPAGDRAGPLTGFVTLEGEATGFRVAEGAAGPELAALPIGEVMCVNYAALPRAEASAEGVPESIPESIPEEHPFPIPVPGWQNGIIPLQSRPGATGVLYIDFDGQKGPQEGWGNFDAEAFPVTAAEVLEVWSRVAEDYAPFELNVTTDLAVFERAPANSRQRCIVTPTTTASPGNGGVAYLSTYNSTGDIPCWAFYGTGENAAVVISHEFGHTLGLRHRGVNGPDPYEYYSGHGEGAVSWAPLMGSSYHRALTQWSRGEYLYSNRFGDDLLQIVTDNNNASTRVDDAGADHAGAIPLEVFQGGTVDSEGNIERTGDVDAFRFRMTGGGNLNLTISPVTHGQNLDLEATLVNASGTILRTSNPDLETGGALSRSLSGGEYTIRVRGVGRGDPLGDGYSNYGSLGQYTIRGTISGAVGPPRFTVAENSPAGTAVGSATAGLRNNHGSTTLAWSITAGNPGGILAIHPSTGAITVALPAALDFEGLSPGWTDPPAFDLTVRAGNPVTPGLTETFRVVVNVTDVNERLLITSVPRVRVLSGASPGTPLGRVVAADPDYLDAIVFSIVGGDPGGAFSMDPAGNILSTANLAAAQAGDRVLRIRAADSGTPSFSVEADVAVTIIASPPALSFGKILLTTYGFISDGTPAPITEHASFPLAPTEERGIPEFDYLSRESQGYGATVRAWMVAPVTGTYRFYVSSDQWAELYLDTGGNPSTAGRIAHMAGSALRREWTKYPTQESAAIPLVAGQLCYIESRHKSRYAEGHLAVGWEIRDTADAQILTPREVLPTRYLAPHSMNYRPLFSGGGGYIYRNCYKGWVVDTLVASDLNPGTTLTFAIESGNESGAFSLDPVTGVLKIANSAALATLPETQSLWVKVTENGPDPLSISQWVGVFSLAPDRTLVYGTQEDIWTDVPGSDWESWYAMGKYPKHPDITRKTEEGAAYSLGYYSEESGHALRVRALLFIPETGDYTFYLDASPMGKMLMSPDDNGQNAVEIINLTEPTEHYNWTQRPQQASAPRRLEGERFYFIEVRVRASLYGSHFTIGWTGPGFPQPTLVPGYCVMASDSNGSPTFGSPSYTFTLPSAVTAGTLAGTVSAVDSPFETILYAILAGDSAGAFTIEETTGLIRVANPAALVPGSTYQLAVGSQDSGHGRRWVPRETTVTVSIVVPPPDLPPVFSGNPVALGPFTVGQPLAVSLAPHVADPGDTFTFSLPGGPSWLSLSTSGQLSATPLPAHFGDHLVPVKVVDSHGHEVTGAIAFTVTADPGSPTSVRTAADAVVTSVYGTISSGTLPANAATSDNQYLILREARTGTSPNLISQLDYQFDFTLPASRLATLRVEAHHSANTEGDDFRFLVSTDGGANYTSAFVVTKTTDDNTLQSFQFTTGPAGLTRIMVVDLDRTPGNSAQNNISIDRLMIEFPGNTAPTVNPATFHAEPGAPAGTVIGQITATDPDAGQTLSFSIPRGNESGYFAISSTGGITAAVALPWFPAVHRLVIVATDDGVPSLANYAIATVTVGDPSPLDIAAGETFTVASGNPAYGGLVNRGKLVATGGTLRIGGHAANHGVLRLIGDAAIIVEGTFQNTGTLDLIHWQGTLPAGLVNTGTILDRSSVRIHSHREEGADLVLAIAGYEGHSYRLETTATFGQPWVPQGASQSGTGTPAVPRNLEFRASPSGDNRFYRIRVHPEP